MDRNLYRVSSLLWQLLLDSRQQWSRWFSVGHPEFITVSEPGGRAFKECLRVLIRTGHPGEPDTATTLTVACSDIEDHLIRDLVPSVDGVWDVAAANMLFNEWKKRKQPQATERKLDTGLIAAHVAAKFDPSVAVYVKVDDRGLGWFRAAISTGEKNGPITHVDAVSAEVHDAVDEDVVADALFDAWKKRNAESVRAAGCGPEKPRKVDGPLDSFFSPEREPDALDSDGKQTQDALRAELKLVESRERDAKRACANVQAQLDAERATVTKLRTRLADLELQLLHYGDLRKRIDQLETELSTRIDALEDASGFYGDPS